MAPRRAPFIAVETDLSKDERPAVIADLCGYNVYEARGRLITLWSWCADRRLRDAPEDCDGYAVPEAVIRRFLGSDGVRAILGDGCDELALGARRPDGLIHLRGTSHTVASFRALRTWSTAGGRSRCESASRVAGRFARSAADHATAGGNVTDNTDEVLQNLHYSSVSQTTNHQQSDQPFTSHAPAVTSVDPDPRSQIPDLRSDLARPGDLVSPSAAKPSPASRSERAIRLPAEWAPRSDELALARDLRVDPSRELAAFRDHHAARGSRFVDWNAAFRTWLRNAVKFSRGGDRASSWSFFDIVDSVVAEQQRGQA